MRTEISKILIFMSCLIAACVITGQSMAANEPQPINSSVNAKVLESKIKEAEALTTIDTDTKNKLVELYRQALTLVDKAQSFEENTKSFEQDQKTAPVETAKLRKQLQLEKKAESQTSFQLSENLSKQELEQRLQKEKANLALVNAKLSEINNQLDSQLDRPADARNRLIEAKTELATILTEYENASQNNDPARVTEALQWQLEKQAIALNAETQMLDMELASYDARLQLLEAKKDMAEFNLSVVNNKVQILEKTLGKRLLAEAAEVQQQTEAAREQLKGKHQLVRELAEKNVNLSEDIGKRTTELERLSITENQTRADVSRIGDELSTIKKKLEISGLSQVLGRVLMKQRQSLPDLAKLRKDVANNEELIANSSLRMVEYRQERRTLNDVDVYTKELTRDLAPDEVDSIHNELVELVKKRLELLNKAITTETSYQRTLGDFDLTQRELINVLNSYNAYLDEHLLWIRSTGPINVSMLANLPEEFTNLFSSSSWFDTTNLLLDELASNFPSNAILIILIALAIYRRRFLNFVINTGDKTRHIRTDSFIHTLEALFWTALSAISLPLIILVIGQQLTQLPDTETFSRAVGYSLLRIAPYFFLLQFFSDVCMAKGLVVKHFRWSDKAAKKLRTEFRRLMLFFLPSGFIAYLSLTLNTNDTGSGLAMLSVVFAISSIGFFVYRSFSVHNGVLQDYFKKYPDTLISRMRYVWLGVLLTSIFSLAVLVMVGYLYTGGTLTRNLIYMLCLIFFLVLVRAMVIRWLLLVSRRLAIQSVLERREASKAAKDVTDKSSDKLSAGNEKALEIDERQVDLAALDAHSRKLLNTVIFIANIFGLWLIWSPVFPAFSILDQISLWSHIATVDGKETLVPVTLSDLLLAIVLALITITASRGLPAFLEFALLQRTSVTAGGRYTATTLLRYTIVGTGIILLFVVLGGSWSQIHWLVAALGVGIGFGLQEIVANFFSGLIILFERPIRVGDIVTVGDTSGTVTKINIRATTITNWDRQELLVPNKEFITNRLLNWSLSDPITRIRIPVGIAYGSDVNKALSLLKEAADAHPNVLEDPHPVVSFEAFGDNSLNMQLRVYLPNIENRLNTITELHEAINRKFNEAGINIAFPQRDIHLDSLGPIDVRLHQDDKP